MKKIFKVFLILYLFYRSFYEYRIVALANTGDLKYKESTIIYFPQPPFSIINPFKKGKLLDKIREYCISDEFEKYHSLKKYSNINHRDFFHYRRLATENSLNIEAIKNEQGILLILVTHEADKELELVFQLDINTDKITGFF